MRPLLVIAMLLVCVCPLSAAEVVGRHIFYSGSVWGDQVAPDKSPLLPGGTATFANYTSYTNGINGIVIDIDELANPSGVDADDFGFRVGNSNNTSVWVAATSPTSVTVNAGCGANGADRVILVWPNNAIQKTWLEITVKANATTGLQSPDVFYFGNAIGECGNSQTDANVNILDMEAVRDNPRNAFNPAPIDFFCDYNRDRNVNILDFEAVRDNGTNAFTALRLITPSSP